jgi:hypothetical protein
MIDGITLGRVRAVRDLLGPVWENFVIMNYDMWRENLGSKNEKLQKVLISAAYGIA